MIENKGYVSYKDKYNTKYGYSKGESHDIKEISKDTGVSMKGLQQIYNKGIGAYKTNPSSVRPNVKSKEQWAMARVYSSVMGGKASKIDSNELKMEKGGLVANELNKIKEAYDFGSEYFAGKIYGQEYQIRMNKNHPRNSNRNDDQSIHNLSLVNVQYPSAVIFRENNNGKLQYQYDKIFYWEDAQEKIEEFFYEINERSDEYAKGGDIKFNGANTSFGLFQELSDKSVLFPKDLIYLWLYEGENAEQKLSNGEYDWVLYPLV
jgi:hypothetical protein